jgi:hypothetical protein
LALPVPGEFFTKWRVFSISTAKARRREGDFSQKQTSQFLPDDLPALKCSAQKSEQVTDCYLAELAASKGMKLATLDAGMMHPAVQVIH